MVQLEEALNTTQVELMEKSRESLKNFVEIVRLKATVKSKNGEFEDLKRTQEESLGAKDARPQSSNRSRNTRSIRHSRSSFRLRLYFRPDEEHGDCLLLLRLSTSVQFCLALR